MRILENLYFYPWMSAQENNANSVFIDGAVPTLIDPGHSHLFSYVAEGMLRDGIDIARTKLVIFTHGHPDHLESTERLDDSVVRAISAKEYAYMQDEGSELFLATAARMPMKPFKLLLNEGTLSLGKETFQVILTPGHSPGSICLYNSKQKVLISGDTLFYLGVGRTDLPGGDINRLAESIGRLAKLDIEYLLPGHGDMLKGRPAIKKNFEIIMAEFFG